MSAIWLLKFIKYTRKGRPTLLSLLGKETVRKGLFWVHLSSSPLFGSSLGEACREEWAPKGSWGRRGEKTCGPVTKASKDKALPACLRLIALGAIRQKWHRREEKLESATWAAIIRIYLTETYLSLSVHPEEEKLLTEEAVIKQCSSMPPESHRWSLSKESTNLILFG